MILHRYTKAACPMLMVAVFTGAAAIASKTQDISVATPESETSILSVLQLVLPDRTDMEFVEQFTTDNFTYVSLNYHDPEAKRVLPWAGTTECLAGLVQTFIEVGRF